MTSTAVWLRQKMLNLIKNLSNCMCAEVVGTDWNTLVTSIAECISIDEVLAKHGDFLNCLLFIPQLLATVKRLLSVCAQFAAYMKNLTEDFIENVERYNLQFNSLLASFLNSIWCPMLHGPGDHPEPIRASVQRVQPCLGLPHGSQSL